MERKPFDNNNYYYCSFAWNFDWNIIFIEMPIDLIATTGDEKFNVWIMTSFILYTEWFICIMYICRAVKFQYIRMQIFWKKIYDYIVSFSKAPSSSPQQSDEKHVPNGSILRTLRIRLSFYLNETKREKSMIKYVMRPERAIEKEEMNEKNNKKCERKRFQMPNYPDHLSQSHIRI